jgi:putative endonuclease
VSQAILQSAYEHREGLVAGFTKRYGCKRLVWFEAFDDIQQARQRELQIKEWKRAWKIKRIEEQNFDWDDLHPTLF